MRDIDDITEDLGKNPHQDLKKNPYQVPVKKQQKQNQKQKPRIQPSDKTNETIEPDKSRKNKALTPLAMSAAIKNQEYGPPTE